MAIRKGTIVRYIGDNELGKGKVFTVRKKVHSHINIYFPCKYLNGEIHNQLVSMPIKDFEEIKR